MPGSGGALCVSTCRAACAFAWMRALTRARGGAPRACQARVAVLSRAAAFRDAAAFTHCAPGWAVSGRKGMTVSGTAGSLVALPGRSHTASLIFCSRARAREYQIRAQCTVQEGARSSDLCGRDHFRQSAACVDSWRPHPSQGFDEQAPSEPAAGSPWRRKTKSQKAMRTGPGGPCCAASSVKAG